VGVAVDPAQPCATGAGAGQPAGPPDDRRTTPPGRRLHRLVPQPADA
jgi:hypothetical protein